MIIIPNFENLEKEILNKFRKFEIGKDEREFRTNVAFNNEDLWFVEDNCRYIDGRQKEISIFYEIPDVGKPKDNEIPTLPEKLKVISTILISYNSPIRSIVENNKNLQWVVKTYSGAEITLDAEADSLISLIRTINDKIIKKFESINNFILERNNAISLRNRIIESMFSHEG